MSPVSSVPPSEPTAPRRTRRPRAALPRLPRTLLAREVAHGRRWDPEEYGLTGPELSAADLTPDDVGRLLWRAEARWRRLEAAMRRADCDAFWIERELALILSRVHPAVVDRWRESIRWRLHHAERALVSYQKLHALVLAAEPEMTRWLRGQLARLDVSGEARP